MLGETNQYFQFDKSHGPQTVNIILWTVRASLVKAV